MSGLEWFLYALVIACGAAGVVWAVQARSRILALPAGNDQMQAIAAAIQEGANAYLRRQYLTIAVVGVVILAVLTYFLGLEVGVGYAIGAICSAAAGFIGMNVSVQANVRTAQAAATSGLAGGLDVAFKAGAATGMVGGGPRPPGRVRLLRHSAGQRGRAAHHPAGAGRAVLRRLADLDLRPPRRRHLHQG